MLDLEALRFRLRQMDDSELLRFGHVTKFSCNSRPESLLEDVIIQLEEVRREWRRRKPEPPLRDSI
jgi:hypothetical protein